VVYMDAGHYHEGVRSCRDGEWAACESASAWLGL
jgi:hypothetical protein